MAADIEAMKRKHEACGGLLSAPDTLLEKVEALKAEDPEPYSTGMHRLREGAQPREIATPGASGKSAV